MLREISPSAFREIHQKVGRIGSAFKKMYLCKRKPRVSCIKVCRMFGARNQSICKLKLLPNI